MINLNEPLTPDIKNVVRYLSKVNDSGWYTNFGPLHDELTKRLELFLGVDNLLLVSNGTVAIQVACKVLNIDSAVTTPFSFVATTSSLLWQGIETTFSDIDINSYNLCPKNLKKSFLYNADCDGVVATHVYGNPCDVVGLDKVAKDFGKKVVYDAAHAFGVKVGDTSVLNFGDASTLSFHATKVFHTVEGGAIKFKNKNDFERAKQLINFGIKPDGSLGEPGINAKLNEYQCAVGLTLLDNIENVIKHRAKLFETYINELKDSVGLPEWHSQASINGSYMPIYIPCDKKRARLVQALFDNDIQYRRYFSPSLDLVFGQEKSFNCRNSNEIAGSVICLPLHYNMTVLDVLKVSSVIKDVI
ncbi:DegT/DnrJ/EryC1/StrS family aminotransferase [Vibrio atlanticus]|nr:DegT/DnrJ/EryC1/StrS family aminotransferase [Vibrio atlanticus]